MHTRSASSTQALRAIAVAAVVLAGAARALGNADDPAIARVTLSGEGIDRTVDVSAISNVAISGDASWHVGAASASAIAPGEAAMVDVSFRRRRAR